MIHCIVKPMEEYVEHLPEGSYGIYTSYGHDPYLFNLISRMTTALFVYEPGFESLPVGRRVTVLANEAVFQETLVARVGDSQVAKHLELLSPEEMLALYMKQDLSHLPLVSEVYKNQDVLKTCMQLRVMQRKRWYRGKLYSNGKVTGAQFRSMLEKADEIGLDTVIKHMLNEQLQKENIKNV